MEEEKKQLIDFLYVFLYKLDTPVQTIMNHERNVGQIEHEPLIKGKINEYLTLGQRIENPPGVQLQLISQTTTGEPVSLGDVASSTAIQCYSGGKAIMRRRSKDWEVGVRKSTLKSGHLTTRQHAHMTFRLDDVTRDMTRDILHPHPFYNTEQQSQRYVQAREGSYLVPADLPPEQRELYLKAAGLMNQSYFELLEPLKNKAMGKLEEISPAAANNKKSRVRLEDRATKLSQEVARYVLPIGQHTTMYHTLSELQLLRMWRASGMSHMSDEAKFVIASMVDSVLEHDSEFIDELEMPATSQFDYSTRPQTVECPPEIQGGGSILDTSTNNPRATLVSALRDSGLFPKDMPDEAVLEQCLNPKNNTLLADLYDVGMHDPITSAQRQVSFNFITRLSHTADSQRQRHRRNPGLTYPVENYYDGESDYIYPMLLQNGILRDKYDQIMGQIYDNVARCTEAGIQMEHAKLLLPNAHAITIRETGDLFDLQHKLRQRLCYLAQEEIFGISAQQTEQVVGTIPELKGLLLAPCGLRIRTGEEPYCPEGARFCGQPVWNWNVDEYEKNRVV